MSFSYSEIETALRSLSATADQWSENWWKPPQSRLIGDMQILDLGTKFASLLAVFKRNVLSELSHQLRLQGLILQRRAWCLSNTGKRNGPAPGRGHRDRHRTWASAGRDLRA
jgi:hypothetical protein